MRTRRVATFLALLAAVTAPAAGRAEPERAGTLVENGALVVDGVERRFASYAPPQASDGPLPLVIALHGHGGRIRGMIGKGLLRSPEAIWMEVADREGFLVFYPQGLKARDGAPGWNDCRLESKANPDTDDVRFLRELIAFAARNHDLDEDRVYLAGLSNGGFMALRMALEASGSVAAVAAVAALMAERSECRDRPVHPVSVLFVLGTEDKLVPFEGGEMLGGRRRGVVHSAKRSVEMWVEWNGLGEAPRREERLPDLDPKDGSIAIRETISSGPDGPEVGLYRLEGHGHTAPSRRVKQGALISMLLGRQNRDVEMVEVIWSFFDGKTRVRREVGADPVARPEARR